MCVHPHGHYWEHTLQLMYMCNKIQSHFYTKWPPCFRFSLFVVGCCHLSFTFLFLLLTLDTIEVFIFQWTFDNSEFIISRNSQQSNKEVRGFREHIIIFAHRKQMTNDQMTKKQSPPIFPRGFSFSCSNTRVPTSCTIKI